MSTEAGASCCPVAGFCGCGCIRSSARCPCRLRVEEVRVEEVEAVVVEVGEAVEEAVEKFAVVEVAMARGRRNRWLGGVEALHTSALGGRGEGGAWSNLARARKRAGEKLQMKSPPCTWLAPPSL